MVDQFARAMASGLERQYAARTQEQYVRTLQKLETEFGALTPVTADLRRRMESYFAKLRERVELGTLTSDTARGELSALRLYYQWAGTDDATEAVPFPSRVRRLPRPMPVHLIDRMLKAATALQDRVMIRCYYHGLRVHEVAGLKTNMLEWSPTDEVIQITMRGKGGKPALVFLNEAAVEPLAQLLLERHASERIEPWLARAPHDAPPHVRWGGALQVLLEQRLDGKPAPLFVTERGHQATVRWADGRFAALRKRAGVPEKYTPHTLRHTCGTELLEAGEDLRTVQEVLRHSDIRSTAVYTEVTRGKRVRALNRLPSVGV